MSPFIRAAALRSTALATTLALTGVFAPSSDQSWLTVGASANDVVNFSFTANTGAAARTAHITLLGQQITVIQAGLAPLVIQSSASLAANASSIVINPYQAIAVQIAVAASAATPPVSASGERAGGAGGGDAASVVSCPEMT